jgi:acyl carrier protein
MVHCTAAGPTGLQQDPSQREQLGVGVIEKVRESVIVALREMNYDTSELTGTTVLGPEGLDLESLAVAELAIRLEDAFGVKFSDEEMAGAAGATLDEFVAVVASRVDPAMTASEVD